MTHANRIVLSGKRFYDIEAYNQFSDMVEHIPKLFQNQNNVSRRIRRFAYNKLDANSHTGQISVHFGTDSSFDTYCLQALELMKKYFQHICCDFNAQMYGRVVSGHDRISAIKIEMGFFQDASCDKLVKQITLVRAMLEYLVYVMPLWHADEYSVEFHAWHWHQIVTNDAQYRTIKHLFV